MNLHTLRLVPKEGSGFHFGREGRELESSRESLPSDSLFGALVVTHLEHFGDPSGFLRPFVENRPSFRLSSLFPYVGEVPLLPLPRLPVKFARSGQEFNRKLLKKVRYVSPAIFTALLEGQAMDEHWESNGPKYSLQEGAVWLHETDVPSLPPDWKNPRKESLREKKVWKTDAVPRVTVDRVSSTSDVYQVGRTVFAGGCGLWVLLEVNTADALSNLKDLFDGLSMAGIGGERSAGYGAFTVKNDLPVPKLPSTSGTSRVVTLSRYYPTPTEIKAGVLEGEAAYDLVKIGGWLATPTGPAQRRKSVYLVEAGSILNHTVPISGALVDVRPDYGHSGAPIHPVYRNGFALTVGVSASVKEDPYAY